MTCECNLLKKLRGFLKGKTNYISLSRDELFDILESHEIHTLGTPKKSIEVQITVNGFTWDEVIQALEYRKKLLQDLQEKGTGVTASGMGTSSTCDVQLRDVTREQFADESIAWMVDQ